jgi:DNA-binding beta-propeller fold protein YncE
MNISRKALARLAPLVLVVAASAASAGFDVKAVPLTSEKGVVNLDYFAFDPATGRLWVPAGNRASVIVLDRAGEVVGTIGDFATAEFELRGRRDRLGPSSVALGNGMAYVGNRADRSICIIDASTMKRGACQSIGTAAQGWAAAPDAVVYVGTTKELWVTRGAPPIGIASSDKAVTIFDVSAAGKLKPKGKVALGASAEGYAVDETRGVFYTNLEERGETVAIDVHRRTIVKRWKSGCDEARGLAIDRTRGLLFVACSDRVVALDADHAGKVLGSVNTGDGLDNIDYSETGHTLYAAASIAAVLTVAQVGETGTFSAVESVPTVKGARGVVAGDARRAYVADPAGGQILIVTQTTP